MLTKLQFYIRHSINDLRVNGQRTFFALLCIAAGVAAIVSLQTLAVMIETTLTGSLQESNRGDIQFQADGRFTAEEAIVQQGLEDGVLSEQTMSFFGQSSTTTEISVDGLAIVQGWAEEQFPGLVELTYIQAISNPAAALLGGTGAFMTIPETGVQANQLTPIVVDTQVYPFYGQIVSTDGRTLAEMIQTQTDVVLNEDTAQSLGAEVGTVINIAGSDQDFTVRGIVASEQQIKGMQDIFLTILGGFYYLDVSAVEFFPDATSVVETVYVKLTNPTRITEFSRAMSQRFPYLDLSTTEDLREQNAEISKNINQLVTVMGLISLLIGSIGIINTMQVIVRRRTLEIAVLKTLGLQADQITNLFLVEAFIMGIIGSIAGIILGLLAVFVVRGAAESLIAQELPFVFAPGAAFRGFLVGVLVTTVFGLLPTLSAGQIRPAIVLRPSDDVVPRAGWLRTLFALAVIIIALTLIAQSILGSFSVSLAVIVGAFFMAGLLYLILWALIWLIARFFPSFGNVDLKISLRQMNAGRRRGAITLLALVVGVFSLSLITLLAESINGLLRYALEDASGGNVTITTISPGQIPLVEDILNETEGVNSYRLMRAYGVTFVSFEESTGETVMTDELAERLESFEMPFAPPDDVNFNRLELFKAMMGRIDARDLGTIQEKPLAAGRDLSPEDAGKPVVVLADNQWLSSVGITVGDKITLAFGSDLDAEEIAQAETITLEVIGIQAESLTAGFDSPLGAPLDSFPTERSPDSTMIIADVEEEQLPVLRRAISAIPGAFALESSLLTQIISTLLGTFTAFPTMVAALGLVVGGVVIANSVALTTMERRKEIAVMKAVGLQRERVLFMILLENGILGLIGGLIGVGIGLIGLVLIVATFSGPSEALPFGTALVLMLLCVAVALIAATATAWNASGEKPLNVLRYE